MKYCLALASHQSGSTPLKLGNSICGNIKVITITSMVFHVFRLSPPIGSRVSRSTSFVLHATHSSPKSGLLADSFTNSPTNYSSRADFMAIIREDCMPITMALSVTTSPNCSIRFSLVIMRVKVVRNMKLT